MPGGVHVKPSMPHKAVKFSAKKPAYLKVPRSERLNDKLRMSSTLRFRFARDIHSPKKKSATVEAINKVTNHGWIHP